MVHLDSLGSGVRKKSKTTTGARGGSGATILDGGEAAWLCLEVLGVAPGSRAAGLRIFAVRLEFFFGV